MSQQNPQAKALADAEAKKAKADAEALAKEEARVKAEADAEAKADAEAQAKAKADAKGVDFIRKDLRHGIHSVCVGRKKIYIEGRNHHFTKDKAVIAVMSEDPALIVFDGKAPHPREKQKD